MYSCYSPPWSILSVFCSERKIMSVRKLRISAWKRRAEAWSTFQFCAPLLLNRGGDTPRRSKRRTARYFLQKLWEELFHRGNIFLSCLWCDTWRKPLILLKRERRWGLRLAVRRRSTLSCWQRSLFPSHFFKGSWDVYSFFDDPVFQPFICTHNWQLYKSYSRSFK